MNPDIIFNVNDRAKFVKILRKTGNPKIFDLCKYLRNTVNRLIRNAKSTYIKENLDTNRNNPRESWRQLKRVKNGRIELCDRVFQRFTIPEIMNIARGIDTSKDSLHCWYNYYCSPTFLFKARGQSENGFL